MEMLSEHQCEGWLEGYLLTGRLIAMKLLSISLIPCLTGMPKIKTEMIKLRREHKSYFSPQLY